MAKDYHQYICNDNSCIIYAREVKKTQLKYAITLGVGYSETSRLEINSIVNTEFSTFPLFADKHYLSLGFDLHVLNYLPQMERTSFKIGVVFFRNNYANNYKLHLISKDTSVNRYFDSYNICLNIRLIQNIFTSQNTPYFGVGFSGLYSFLESYHDYKYTNSLFNNSISNSLNQFQFGVNLSLGYQWSMLNSKLFNIEFQYKKFLSKQFNAYIILGYEF